MIEWIPGHCNIPGNTLANELANQEHALENDNEYPLELKELICCTKDALQEQWLWVRHHNSLNMPETRLCKPKEKLIQNE